MRDNILVQAQNQIDALAASMAQTLSSQTVAGATASSGLQTGFSVETAGLLNGNRINLTYTDTVGSVQHRVSIVRVDDPTALPLTNDATADPNDEVIGIDFSGGLASVATQLNALFGPGLQFTATGSVLEVLDDGAGATTDVNSLSVTQTATTLVNGDPALALFTDGTDPFTGAISGVSTQSLGLAARIAVNPQLLADPAKLVLYASGTASGDPTRPDLIYDRLMSASVTFPAGTGFGSASSPYVGTLPDFLRQVLTTQGDAAANASNLAQGQAVVVNSLKERMNEASGVNIDQEMTNLIRLQTAYGANARVMSAVREMIDALLKI
jgi:flagellar hook-associated protein 1 FlgK